MLRKKNMINRLLYYIKIIKDIKNIKNIKKIKIIYFIIYKKLINKIYRNIFNTYLICLKLKILLL